MAQNPPRLCPNCGTPAEPNQRFCAECGTTLSMVSNQPTALASGEQSPVPVQGSGAQFATPPEPGNGASGSTVTAPTQLAGTQEQAPAAYPVANPSASGSQFYSQATEANPIPPPPPPDSLIAPLYSVPESTVPSQPTPVPGTYVVPDYARAPRRSRVGLIVSLALLLVLALGAVAAYALFFNKANSNKQGNQGNTPTQNTPVTSGNTPANTVTATTSTGSSSTPGSGSTTPTTSASTTANGPTSEQVNLAFTYASISMTVTSVQFATSFTDDSSTPGGVRIAFSEQNTTKNNPNVAYSDAARLILPDHSSIAPTNELYGVTPDAQTTRTNWLDFPVTSQPADLSQLVLQMGTATENQMQIPLKAGADLSQYSAKTVTPGTKFQYAGLNWTLTSATQSLSATDKQATSGNVYVSVTLSVYNPQQSDFNAYYGDFARLTSAGTTNAPTSDSTLPTSVASQTSATGTLIFLAPQGNTAYNLVMLAVQSSPPVTQVTVPFTIQ